MNTVINSVPLTLHQYCRTETNLKKRITLGQIDINILDSVYRDRYIAFEKNNSLSEHSFANCVLWKTMLGRKSMHKTRILVKKLHRG